jgi:CubicO group peptidase (beta-lactamase class C family)
MDSDFPRAETSEVGLVPERLKRIDVAFQSEVDEGRIPGAVVLVARNGSVAYLKAFGFQDRERQLGMKTDAIFRIASLTKPITSVAMMILVEEGKVHLSEPVSKYLPQLRDLQVGHETANSATGTLELLLERIHREITIQDLMRHTSGFTYGTFGNSLVDQAYRKANVLDPNQTLAELVTKVSRLPLAFQPGTTFEYSLSTDIVGRLIEIVSGMELDQFVKQRITGPLTMPDTAFYVTGNQVPRLAEPQVDKATGVRPPMRDVINRPKWMSGGGGMISTASDYARFSQMLLNGGRMGSVQLLSPKTVAFMTSDHLPPGTAMSPTVSAQFGSTTPSPVQGQGFGLGFAVRTHLGRNSLPGSPGDYYWVGATGTVFWVDPKERLVVVMMVQVPLLADEKISLIRNLVYQSIAS